MSWKENSDPWSHLAICFEELTWLAEGRYNQRRIVSAANKYTLVDGREIMLPCVRHGGPDISNTLKLLKEQGLVDHLHCKPDDQGFVDQYRNWWSREDAFIIATAADQVNMETNGSDNELYSEGLY